MAFDPNDEADKKILADAIAAEVEKQTTGLKNKNTEVILDNKKLKAEITTLLSKTDGIDIERLRELQGRLEKDEDARLIAEGKTQEVVDRRTKLMREDFDRQLKETKDKAEANLAFANRFRDATLANSIRDAAMKNGVEATAADDVIYRAKAAGFQVDDEGNPVLKDSKGEVVLGKDGKTPLQPSEWVEGLRERAPHLWPKASGGGAGGGGHATTKKWSELTEAERVALYKKDPAEYARVRDLEKTT